MDFLERLSERLSRRVTFEVAQKMRKEGYKAVILHVHSNRSSDVEDKREHEPLELLKKANRISDYCTITDHDNDDAWQQHAYRPRNWIRSMEKTAISEETGQVHLGIYQINDELAEFLQYECDSIKIIEKSLESGATVVANHPWCLVGLPYNTKGYWEVIHHYQLPVEINDKRPFHENFAALFYSSVFDVPLIATSDTHFAKIGPVLTLAKGDSPEEMFSNIRENSTFYVTGNMDLDSPEIFVEYFEHSLKKNKMVVSNGVYFAER